MINPQALIIHQQGRMNRKELTEINDFILPHLNNHKQITAQSSLHFYFFPCTVFKLAVFFFWHFVEVVFCWMKISPVLCALYISFPV